MAAAGITAVLLFFLTGGGAGTSQAFVAGLIFAAIGAAFAFWILRSGRVNRPRLFLFLAMGLLFGIAFSLEHEINRGSILLTEKQIQGAEVPICPITVPFVVPPLAI